MYEIMRYHDARWSYHASSYSLVGFFRIAVWSLYSFKTCRSLSDTINDEYFLSQDDLRNPILFIRTMKSLGKTSSEEVHSQVAFQLITKARPIKHDNYLHQCCLSFLLGSTHESSSIP